MNLKEREKGEIYGNTVESYERSEEKIFEKIYPEHLEDLKKIRESNNHYRLTTTLMENIGGSNSILVKLSNKIPEEGKEYNFMVRHYREDPERLEERGVDPRIKDKACYEFLRDAGIKSVPRTYTPRGSNFMFMEWLEGHSLSEDLDKMDSAKERKELLIDKVLEPLADFQYKASKKLVNLSSYQRDKLFSGRSIGEKAKDYFSKITKGRVGIREVEAYKELISRIYEGNCVLHGDLSYNNIISNSEINFIDNKLKLGKGLADVGSLLAYLGMKYDLRDHWEDIGSKFLDLKLKTEVENSLDEFGYNIKPLDSPKRNLISRILSFGRGGNGEGKIDLSLSEEKRKENLFNLYAAIFHQSFRILAKNQKTHLYGKDHEERLKQQMDYIIGQWISEKGYFNFSKRDSDSSKILMNKCIPRYGENDSQEEAGNEAIVEEAKLKVS